MPGELMDVPFAPFPVSEKAIKLDRISLAKIRDNDAVESSSFYLLCQSLGFFLLHMDDSPEGRLF
jgi:hypothetical protein